MIQTGSSPDRVLSKYGRRHSSEPVSGHLSFVEHPLQAFQNRVVAHWLIWIPIIAKHQFSRARQVAYPPTRTTLVSHFIVV